MAIHEANLAPPADAVPVFFPNFVAYVRPQDLGDVQALGRLLLDVAEAAIAASGDIPTDPTALSVSVATARAAIDVEHLARQFREEAGPGADEGR